MLKGTFSFTVVSALRIEVGLGTFPLYFNKSCAPSRSGISIGDVHIDIYFGAHSPSVFSVSM